VVGDRIDNWTELVLVLSFAILAAVTGRPSEFEAVDGGCMSPTQDHIDAGDEGKMALLSLIGIKK